jgi:hypothetical protein
MSHHIYDPTHLLLSAETREHRANAYLGEIAGQPQIRGGSQAHMEALMGREIRLRHERSAASAQRILPLCTEAMRHVLMLEHHDETLQKTLHKSILPDENILPHSHMPNYDCILGTLNYALQRCERLNTPAQAPHLKSVLNDLHDTCDRLHSVVNALQNIDKVYLLECSDGQSSPFLPTQAQNWYSTSYCTCTQARQTLEAISSHAQHALSDLERLHGTATLHAQQPMLPLDHRHNPRIFGRTWGVPLHLYST